MYIWLDGQMRRDDINFVQKVYIWKWKVRAIETSRPIRRAKSTTLVNNGSTRRVVSRVMHSLPSVSATLTAVPSQPKPFQSVPQARAVLWGVLGCAARDESGVKRVHASLLATVRFLCRTRLSLSPMTTDTGTHSLTVIAHKCTRPIHVTHDYLVLAKLYLVIIISSIVQQSKGPVQYSIVLTFKGAF